jgi:NAD(P)-dependent dehydrogenase (short-subunit alcohol dehydrogenase family)
MANSPVVLVTGASTGLGRLIVETLAGRGHRSFAGMRDVAGRNADNAKALHARNVTPVELDVTDEASCAAAVETVIESAGRIDVLINNAGIGVHGLTECFAPEEAKRVFDTNFFGVVRMNRAVLPHMRKRDSGFLIHMSSGGGRALLPCMAYYCASKFALEALAESYRYELANLGIDCTIVEPGSYPSPFWGKEPGPADDSRRDGYGPVAALPETMRRVYASRTAGPDAGDPQEVADACLALIEMTPGTRPVRLLVGERVQEVGVINEAQAEVQRSFYSAYGVEHLMRFGYDR